MKTLYAMLLLINIQLLYKLETEKIPFAVMLVWLGIFVGAAILDVMGEKDRKDVFS